MIRLRPSGADEVLIKRVQDWYEPGPGVFIQSLTASFSPAMLFTGSTTGAWYDPSDITTLYQDAAGTTPVTAVEQPVGRMLDKSGKGNHAFNASGNSANFPVLQQDGTGRYYLAFNGTNQWLQTNSIDFTYGDKMFVCAGVRHLSNANYCGLVGLGATVGTAGSFLLWTRSAAGIGGFEWYSNGNATGTITESATPTLPRTSVVSATGDISLTGAANELKLRINGSLATTTAAGDCGTGNYANAVITIGSYNASNFFNGRLHQLVVAGKQASASEIGQTEAFTNQKTGAY